MGLLTSCRPTARWCRAASTTRSSATSQDDWRATPKLTFNLGVRYELPFQWYQPNGYSSTFIPGHQSTVFPGAMGGLAYPGDPAC
jgi:outer membrane receptor protein involved in Fe transport